MTSIDPVEAYAEAVGAPSFAEFQTSYLVASWFSELVAVHRGARLVGLIPSGVCARLREAKILTSRRNNKNGVDLELASDLASKPWVPDYKPGPYIPEVDDSELNKYHPKSRTGETITKPDLADALPEEDTEDVDPSYDPSEATNPDIWLDETDFPEWAPMSDRPPKRRHRL